MIARSQALTQHPVVFQALTGLSLAAFDSLAADVAPALAAAARRRVRRPSRRRASGAGRRVALSRRDQVLLTVVWRRRYPIHAVRGFLFGVEETTALRTGHRVLPVLEAAGLETLRLPDPGKGKRPDLDTLVQDTPALAVLVDTFEQRAGRPRTRAAADPFASGKKKAHTLKTQVAIDARDGRIVAIAIPPRCRGPTADLTLLRESGLLARLPPGVGALGDLASVGIAQLHPQGLAATPRRKPRGQPRPAEDSAFNTAFARRRVGVEHSIGRLRADQPLSQTDRQHRRHHTERARAIAGLVNRCLPA